MLGRVPFHFDMEMSGVNKFGMFAGFIVLMAGVSFGSADGYGSGAVSLIFSGLVLFGIAFYEEFLRGA